ncbi:MAG: hypothetical protein LBP85_05760 [Prevotellaceae bacterium]|jgi:hypothetical protein|nr:hypothetical protein [Prevotellaceae bacterium]
MRVIYKTIVVIAVSSIFASCTQEPSIKSISKISIKKDNFWNLQSSDIILAKNVGKYADIYVPSDFYAVISAQKNDPLQDVFYSSYNGKNKNIAETQSSQTSTNIFSVTANTIELKTIDDIQISQKKSEKEEDLSSLYGKNVKFSIRNANHTQSVSSSTSDTTVSMYVPELIEIFSPSVLTKEDMYPLCYYENFILRWNADENNENGVAIIVTWTGSMAFGQDHPNISIRRTDVVPDNGSAVLNSHLFDDIPDTGIILLTLARGNVENIGLQDNYYKYQILSETHAVLPLILIRNIKKLSDESHD